MRFPMLQHTERWTTCAITRHGGSSVYFSLIKISSLAITIYRFGITNYFINSIELTIMNYIQCTDVKEYCKFKRKYWTLNNIILYLSY